MYYSQLLEFAILCTVLFLLNLPVMACNAGFKRYINSGCKDSYKPPGICGLEVEDLYNTYYGTSNVTSIMASKNITVAFSNSTGGASVICPVSHIDLSNGESIDMGDFSQMSGMKLTALQGVIEVLCSIAMILFVYLRRSMQYV